jgi:hypothetical protein
MKLWLPDVMHYISEIHVSEAYWRVMKYLSSLSVLQDYI